MKIFKFIISALFLLALPVHAQDTSKGKTRTRSYVEFKADLKWGAGGADEGMFVNPGGLCVDAGDNVYVADDGNNRVQKFDGEGKYLSSFSDFLPISDPVFAFKMGGVQSIAVDKDGSFYFRTSLMFYGFTAEGKNIYYYSTGGYFTTGYFLSREGFLYDLFQANGGGGNIYKRNRLGKYLVEFPDQCSDPRGVVVDSQGNIYALDGGLQSSNEDRGVQKYSSTGDFLLKWGTFGEKDSQFNNPADMAIDREDHIYVLDSVLDRVQVFTPDGKLWCKWGQQGIGLGAMRGPTALAVNSKGQVYILDAGNNRVQRFTPYQVEETLNAKGKVLKKTETPLLDTLVKTAEEVATVLPTVTPLMSGSNTPTPTAGVVIDTPSPIASPVPLEK